MEAWLSVLPLAIVMMAGPQELTSIFLVTSKNVVKNSLSFISGVLLAATIGTSIAMFLGTRFEQSAGDSTLATLIDWILVGLLIYLTIKAYRGRKTSTTPKWMTSLQNTEPRRAFKLGFSLILFFPSDIIVMLSVGRYLTSNGLGLPSAVPFILLTTFIAALPFLFYLAFKKKAEEKMPSIRDWTNNNSWLINIVVYLFFIYLILG